MTGWTVSRYERFDTSPETIEQETCCLLTATDRFKKNYNIDYVSCYYVPSRCYISVAGHKEILTFLELHPDMPFNKLVIKTKVMNEKRMLAERSAANWKKVAE